MKLVDLKRSKAEKKARTEEHSIGSADEDYPYGTRIRLEHEDMEKLGMKDTPAPGDTFHIEAHGKVTHSHESADEKGKRRHVEIHLTKLGAEAKEDTGGLRTTIEKAHDNQGNKITKGKEGADVKKAEKGKDGAKGTAKPGVG